MILRCPKCGGRMKKLGILDLDVYYICENGHIFVHPAAGGLIYLGKDEGMKHTIEIDYENLKEADAE